MSEVEIEVFRVGRSSRGIGERELDQAVAAYSPDTDPAPLVIGHPSNDKPAHGVVAKVRRVGDRLLATLQDISDEAVTGVRTRRFLNRSIAFWHPDHASNPTPGRWNIRHLGLLGAASPGIPGMPKLAFADAFTFSGAAPAEEVVYSSSGAGVAHPGETQAYELSATDAPLSAELISFAARRLVDKAAARGERLDFVAAVGAVSGEHEFSASGDVAEALGFFQWSKVKNPPDDATKLLQIAYSLIDQAAARGERVSTNSAIDVASGSGSWPSLHELQTAVRAAGGSGVVA
jgi:hypothetical protein